MRVGIYFGDLRLIEYEETACLMVTFIEMRKAVGSRFYAENRISVLI